MRQAWQKGAIPRLCLCAAGLMMTLSGTPAFAAPATMHASARIVDPAGIQVQQDMMSQGSITLILSGTESDLRSVKVPSDLTRIDRDALYPMLADMDSGPGLPNRYAVSVAMDVFRRDTAADVSSESHLLIMAQYN